MLIRWSGKYKILPYFFAILFLTSRNPVSSQIDMNSAANFCGTESPEGVNKKKLRRLIIAESGSYAVGMTGCYFLWYKNAVGGGFHFFDDTREWMMMDKMGHFATSYIMTQQTAGWYQRCGLQEKNANKIAALQTVFVMTSVEVFDGFSRNWGFSPADFGFNVLGAGAYWISNLHPRISILPKFSYGNSEIAQYRPDVLGSNFPEKLLKDYNGQTYWWSVNLNKLIAPGVDWGNFKSAICFSFGYGAHGMTGGHENVFINEQGEVVPYFQRYNQFYLSLDLDLTKIRTKNFPFLGRILKAVNILKIPFPGVEFSRGNVFMNWTGYGI